MAEFKDYVICELVDDPSTRYLLEAPLMSHLYPGDIIRDQEGELQRVVIKDTFDPNGDYMKFILQTGIEETGRVQSVVKEIAIAYGEEEDD